MATEKAEAKEEPTQTSKVKIVEGYIPKPPFNDKRDEPFLQTCYPKFHRWRKELKSNKQTKTAYDKRRRRMLQLQAKGDCKEYRKLWAVDQRSICPPVVQYNKDGEPDYLLCNQNCGVRVGKTYEPPTKTSLHSADTLLIEGRPTKRMPLQTMPHDMANRVMFKARLPPPNDWPKNQNVIFEKDLSYDGLVYTTPTSFDQFPPSIKGDAALLSRVIIPSNANEKTKVELVSLHYLKNAKTSEMQTAYRVYKSFDMPSGSWCQHTLPPEDLSRDKPSLTVQKTNVHPVAPMCSSMLCTKGCCAPSNPPRRRRL